MEFTNQGQKALENSHDLAQHSSHPQILPLHLAIALLDPPEGQSLFRQIVDFAGGDPQRLDRALKKALVGLPCEDPPPENVYLSPQFSKVLQSANELKIAQKDSFIAIDHLIQALSQDPSIQRFMADANIPNTKLIDSTIQRIRGTKEINSKTEDLEQDNINLEKFTINITSMARRGEVDPLFGREGEIRQVLQILLRRTKKIPLLVGEPGVGKTTIVGGFARRIINADIPDYFANCKLLSLDISSLIAGNKYRGEIEERFTGILKEIEGSEEFIVLFIDDIHLLMGARSEREGAMNVANLIKPILARRQLHCIGATTPAEYRKNIQEDPFIARGFQQVLVKEPTVPETVSILRGLKGKYEIQHGTTILNGAIVRAATLAAQHPTARFLPDSALDLIDEAAAAIRYTRDFQPEALETVNRKLWELQIEIDALEREKSDAARARRAQAQQEASSAEKDRKLIYERCESKKQRYNDIQNCKVKYDRLKVKQEEAEREHDLQLASDLLYYAMPEARGRIEQLEADSARIDAELCASAVRGSPGAREDIFPNEVGPDQINEIVARWTGIPVARLRISGEDELL